MKINEVTLLSIEEYESCKEYIKPLDEWWWLCTLGYNNNFDIVCVAPENRYAAFDFASVRPALRVNPKSTDIVPGKEYQLYGQTWTAISDSLLLCDQGIKQMPFRKDVKAEDANDYEKSDAKRFLDSWAKERGILNQEKTADREIQNESVDKAPENGEVEWGKNASKKQDKKKKIRR